MILIIAEKPSLARNIAAGIGKMTKRDGYMEGCGYIISWAFGHLFSLCDIEEYSPSPESSGRWTMDNIPCFPDKFKFELRRDENKKIDPGVKKQFETLRTLCCRDDVDTIVNAGDADREGEIIIRLCVENALSSPKTLKRLWLPDQTPQTVAKALSEMKDESEYDMLADEGFARTYIDWLYGVNLTRYATLRTGTLLRVGRVIVPIVRAIYERDMAIKNFVPGKYLAISSSEETGGEKIELLSKKKFESGQNREALELCALYNQTGARVTAVRRKKDKLSPGKLYSLSKLQNVLGKKYKMSMQESLDIVQKLYERGYLTYPRTNSEYLATAEKDKIKGIISACSKLGYPVKFKDGKNIFNDAKIESHSALTPTYKIPKKTELSEKENQVYSTVFRRFVAVFCSEDCVISKAEMTVSVGELEDFVLKGSVILEPGWTKYDDRSGKDKILPELKKGDEVVIDFKPVEKETSPPKHYTIETLNNYLKNPFREENAARKNARQNESDEAQEGAEDSDDEDYRAVFEGLELGTEATRTGIIDNARKSRYISLKKDVYTILPGGEFLVESLDRLCISMDKYKTSELGQALKKVYHGKMTVDESVALAEAQISEIFSACSDGKDTGFFGDIIGKCPLCGKDVRRMRDFYGCSGYKENGCKFSVRTSICQRAISLDMMRSLLQNGRTAQIDGFISKKSGKPFSAALKLDETGRAVFDFEQEKQPAPAQRQSFGACPRCGKPVIKGKAAYGCSGWREGCEFRVSFEQDGKTVDDDEIRRILSGEIPNEE